MPKKPNFKNYLKALKLIKSDPELKERFDENQDGTLDPNELEKGAAELGNEIKAESGNEPSAPQTPETHSPKNTPGKAKGRKFIKLYSILIVVVLLSFALTILFPETFSHMIFIVTFAIAPWILIIKAIVSGEVYPVGYYWQIVKRDREPFGYWISLLTWAGFAGGMSYLLFSLDCSKAHYIFC